MDDKDMQASMNTKILFWEPACISDYAIYPLDMHFTK